MNSVISDKRNAACVTLIGMAGAGKTTTGSALARHMGWVHLDTDDLIEATYGAPLQAIADAMTKEAFLDMESMVIRGIWTKRTVISTGGSVVHRDEAMTYLKDLGPVVHLKVSLPLILERIARNPDRGLAIAPGQTVEDLFIERERLYERYADFTLDADSLDPATCARAMDAFLRDAACNWNVHFDAAV